MEIEGQEKTAIPESLRNEARNELYNILKEALNQLPLIQQVGYDLANDMMNIPYSGLRDKYKQEFDKLLDDMGTRMLFLALPSDDLDSYKVDALKRFAYLRKVQRQEERDNQTIHTTDEHTS